MNKLTIITIASVAILTSCTKQDLKVAEKLPQENKPNKELRQGDPELRKSLRVYYDNGGPIEGRDFGCWGSGGTCLDDVVIKAGPSISNLVDLVLSNQPYTQFVINNTTGLSDYIPAIFLTGIADGTYTLSIKTTDGATTKYLKFINAASEISLVIPLI